MHSTASTVDAAAPVDAPPWRVEALCEALKSTLMDKVWNAHPMAERDLLIAMGVFIRRRCGLLNKLDERIFDLSQPSPSPSPSPSQGLASTPTPTPTPTPAGHRKMTKGADFVDPTTGARLEHKASRVMAKHGYKCNFNFNLGVRYKDCQRDDDARKRYIASKMEELCGGGPGGAAVLEVKLLQDDTLIHTCRLSCAFLKAYAYTMNKTHFNLSCQRCDHCQRYHRLDVYEALDQVHTAALPHDCSVDEALRMLPMLTSMGQIKRQCSPRPAHAPGPARGDQRKK